MLNRENAEECIYLQDFQIFGVQSLILFRNFFREYPHFLQFSLATAVRPIFKSIEIKVLLNS